MSQLLFFKVFSFFFDPIWLPDHVTNDIIFIKAYFPLVVDQLVTFCINQLSGFSPKIFKDFPLDPTWLPNHVTHNCNFYENPVQISSQSDEY